MAAGAARVLPTPWAKHGQHPEPPSFAFCRKVRTVGKLIKVEVEHADGGKLELDILGCIRPGKADRYILLIRPANPLATNLPAVCDVPLSPAGLHRVADRASLLDRW